MKRENNLKIEVSTLHDDNEMTLIEVIEMYIVSVTSYRTGITLVFENESDAADCQNSIAGNEKLSVMFSEVVGSNDFVILYPCKGTIITVNYDKGKSRSFVYHK